MTTRRLEDEIANPDATSLRGPALGRVDWVRAGLEALIESGVEAVKITKLAERLGVTRGSFYWHFRDREDILQALIEYWERKNTRSILAAAAQGPDLLGSVLALMEVWIDAELYDPPLELSIRGWGRSDPDLRARIHAADDARIAALTQMYLQAGRSPEQAVVAARNIYYMQMGYYALEVRESFEARMGYLASYIQSFTGETLPESRRLAFIAKIRAGQDI